MSADMQNILIVGVGGQGTILASRALAAVVLRAGFEVKVSEIHGMAQRGGSVVTQARWGERVFSPIIPPGEAGIILAFEKLEALRWLPWLRRGGQMLVSDQRIDPMPVVTGAAAYPEDAIAQMRAAGAAVTVCDGLALARQAGNAKAVNIVLLGLLSRCLEFAPAEWEAALRAVTPPRFLDVNLEAFRLGRSSTA
ncbi:MAG: indolepyruvate oxidoreductase subunit beta [Gracilibacteraceae bacterium]|jgi:indolepyruvate ferredoxin oxidoreductase beta subunit|nr:indolepyruvate oxidoreductase subunit beta [Gracilibacteraceae bacterium]